ncbi:hypothetical protein B0A58_02905 [Flavobacterium branchiophilum NBRC 15030 = ATCC 35035]|nr:DUF1801 domain-containing protein [Flavobacterium branchiophilum]OXA80126.1 hypothetical protein B0A58_02905 [Flavobacterium branchiophilum NBRC 15030 = ATCC 35035]GEM54913.1 hypothetical protein FB1_11340 [Flavobacterium branchiophilum NBRC 15030 = ATCC 35035]
MNMLEVQDYLSNLPVEKQNVLQNFRIFLQDLLPMASETMAYGIPTFKYEKNIVHYAAFKNHLGFYPSPAVILHFQEELTAFKTSKGAIQFPFSEEIPLELVKKMVLFRLNQMNIK